MDSESIELSTVRQVIQKLGGVLGVRRFLNDELIAVPLHKRLWTGHVCELNDGDLTPEPLQQLADCMLTESVCHLIRTAGDNYSVLTNAAYEITSVSMTDLGFHNGALGHEICKRAQLMGLSSIPVVLTASVIKLVNRGSSAVDRVINVVISDNHKCITMISITQVCAGGIKIDTINDPANQAFFAGSFAFAIASNT